MKEIIKLPFFLLVLTFISCTSTPTLCECLKTKGDLPNGCEQVFKDRYGTTEPSIKQMESDYYNCE